MRNICLSVFLFVFCLSGRGGGSAVEVKKDTATKNPIGHWAFDEGRGTIITDLSGNGHDAFIVNQSKSAGEFKYPVKWVEGRSGKALKYTAEDRQGTSGHVVIPDLGRYDFSGGMTVELWVNFDKETDPKGLCDIITNMASSNYGPGFRLYYVWKRVVFGSAARFTRKTYEVRTNMLEAPLTPGVWQHIAGVYDGSIYKIYLDGEEVAVSKPGLKMTGGYKDITIGAFPFGKGRGFRGIIDDVRIYAYPLTAREVLRHAIFD